MKKSWQNNHVMDLDIDGNTVSMFVIPLPDKFQLPCDGTSFYGIDPGYKHIGFSTISGITGFCYEITCRDFFDQMDRATALKNMMSKLISTNSRHPEPKWIIMEGSSHAEKFGQTSLAEARLSLALGASEFGIVKFVPPSTIRKYVFGKGNLRGEDVYKNELPPNAAASLGCACYAHIWQNH